VSETGPGAQHADAEASPGTAGQDPWLRFALLFGLLAVLSEVVYYAVALDSQLFRSYLNALARISSWILGALGEEMNVREAILSGKLFSVEIAQGCDAYRICALLSAAIIAFPARLGTKLWGLVLGLLWLNALNFVRIVSLYYIGGLWHAQFKHAHEIYFPVFLICMTVLAWVLWVRRATRDLDLSSSPA
jgi:exosortase H (IPTLxxWG-CTERM-specific)